MDSLCTDLGGKINILSHSRRQKSLASYSPWGRKESDTTKACTHVSFLGVPLVKSCQDCLPDFSSDMFLHSVPFPTKS